jgi:hypothetical protein
MHTECASIKELWLCDEDCFDVVDFGHPPLAANLNILDSMSLVRINTTTSVTLLSDVDPSVYGSVCYSFGVSQTTSYKCGFSMAMNSATPPTAYVSYSQASNAILEIDNALARTDLTGTTRFGGASVSPGFLAILDDVIYGTSYTSIFKACA